MKIVIKIKYENLSQSHFKHFPSQIRFIPEAHNKTLEQVEQEVVETWTLSFFPGDPCLKL